MMNPKGMVFLFVILNIDNITMLRHSYGEPYIGPLGGGWRGGSGRGQFDRIYSADFETYEDCATECGYVTGEAEAACKAIAGGACVTEAGVNVAIKLITWGLSDAGGTACQAASGTCSITDSEYIGLQRACEEYCGIKFPSKFELTQRNNNATRQVLINGQTKLKNNLKELSDSIANNHKDITMQLISAQEEIIDNIVEEVQNSQSLILHSIKVSEVELLADIKQFFKVSAKPLLKAINSELDVLGKELQDVKHAVLFGDVFSILDKVETQYKDVKHDPSTDLIEHSFDSDQYVAAVTDYNEGMVIGIKDIMDMLVTGNGRNWIKGNSIYQESPSEFCSPKWFTFFHLKLTKALYHYRLGRKMQGNPLPASHKEEKFHGEHLEHYSNVCQCKREDLPTIDGRTPICKTISSTSTVGDICTPPGECWGQVQNVICEEGGNWRVDETWIERDDNANWICKARVLWTGPLPSQTFHLPDFNPVHSDCQVADPRMDRSKSVFQEVEGKVYGCNHVECKQYFPEENTWTFIPGTKFVSEHYHGAGTLVEGKWVVQGGYAAVRGRRTEDPTAEVWIPGTENWVEAPEYNSPLPVEGHCMVRVKNRTFQIGGWSRASGGYTSRCFLDGDEVASLNAPRSSHACAMFQGQVWVAGGLRNDGHVVEIYDPHSNTWREGPRRPTSGYDVKPQLLVEENTNQLYYIGGDGIGKIYRLSQNKDDWEEVADIQRGDKYAAIVMKKRC